MGIQTPTSPSEKELSASLCGLSVSTVSCLRANSPRRRRAREGHAEKTISPTELLRGETNTVLEPNVN
jgi:hypothetical protein